MSSTMTIRELGAKLQKEHGLHQEPQQVKVSPQKPKGPGEGPHFLQSKFLKQWRDNKTPLRFVSMNGEVVSGRIVECDQFTVFVITEEGKTILFHKHGIARYEEGRA